MATKYKMPTIDIGTYDTLPQWKKNQMDKLKKKTSPGEPKLNKKKKIEPKVEKPKVKIETKETKKSPPKKKKKSFWSRFKPISAKEKIAGEKRDAYKTASATTPMVAQEVVSVNPISKNIKTKDVEVKTEKGGDFPVMKKKSVAAESFRDAFSAARNPKSGKREKTFTWQGRSYTTRQAGEGKWDAKSGKWGKAAKKQMGGPIEKGPMIGEKPFKQGIKYYEGGGQVTVSNDKAGTGDVVHTHSHSGYKAGE